MCVYYDNDDKMFLHNVHEKSIIYLSTSDRLKKDYTSLSLYIQSNTTTSEIIITVNWGKWNGFKRCGCVGIKEITWIY